jgi:transcriptional regulator with XRE-family HTH domain
MAIGKQIRKYRLQLGWKLWQLSDASGVDVGTISALEQRDSKKSDYFLPIAAGLGLTLEQLADEGEMHTPNPSENAPSKPAVSPAIEAQAAIKSEAQNVNLDYLVAQITDPVLRAEAVRDAVAIILTAIRRQKSSPWQEVAQTHETPAE